jgi:cytoskeleton protein RodZ
LLDNARPGSDLAQLVVIGLIVAGAVAYVALQNRTSPGAVATAAPAPVATTATVAAASMGEAVGTSGVVSAVDVSGQGLKVEIAASGPCWIGATADGTPGVQRLMNAGERETLTARESLTLRVGDPGAFTYTINGVKTRPVGTAGQPVTLKINPQNYREFIAS